MGADHQGRRRQRRIDVLESTFAAFPKRETIMPE
jgi:hypothetical protein